MDFMNECDSVGLITSREFRTDSAITTILCIWQNIHILRKRIT